MTTIHVKPAQTAIMFGKRYVVCMFRGTEGDYSGLHALSRFHSFHKWWQRIGTPFIGVLALVQLGFFISNFFPFFSLLLLLVNGGYLIWDIWKTRRNLAHTTEEFKAEEEQMVLRGIVTRVEDDDPILSHAFETIHRDKGTAEEKAQAQRLLDLTIKTSFHRGVTSGVQLLIHEGGADSPEADELRAFLPQSMKNYEESQQAYLNARLEYTIPELV